MKYEAIVVGSGPAGLSSAIYLGRADIKTLLVGKREQSQLIKAHWIENFLGFPNGITGKDLLDNGIKQAKRFHVSFVEDEVVDAKKIDEEFTVKLGNGAKHTTKTLILATGTPIRLSGITNEEELTGKGVHYCADCDGPFYKNKKVAVIGNGNHAAEDAMELLLFTKNVTIISNAEKFEFSPEMEKKLKKKNIKLVNTAVIEFSKKKFLDAIVVTGNKRLKFDGAFMACGTASALDFASELGLDIENNILKVNQDNMTNIKGIFAAGNCCGRCRQVAKNVGDGCNAALGLIKFLRNRQLYVDYGRSKNG